MIGPTIELLPLNGQTGFICRRAFAAFVKSDMREMLPSTHVPEYKRTRPFTIEGRCYVALRSPSKIVAVYRLTNRGLLKRLRRYPLGAADLQLILDDSVIADAERMIDDLKQAA